MILPCETCIHKTEREEGFRIYIGCNDPKLKEEGFIEDTWTYSHRCTNHSPNLECLECKYYNRQLKKCNANFKSERCPIAIKKRTQKL